MLSEFERRLERFIDSAVAGGFRLHVQPAEIGRQLERALLNGTTTSVGGAMAPNSFTVHLHPDDASAFDHWSDALCHEMERWLADLAFRRGLVTIAPMQVTIEADARVRRRTVHVNSDFFQEAQRSPNLEHASPSYLSLIAVEGSDRYSLRPGGQSTIGRSAGNDVIIDDERISRRHAVLQCDRGEWHINDLGSTNGTWVNGRRVSCSRLADEDEVGLGNRRFRVRLE